MSWIFNAFLFLSITLASSTFVSNPAIAQNISLNGLCLDNRKAGCMGRYLPFRGDTIDFCEESCRLTNPVPVRGLAGTLYDLKCAADFDTPMEGRVMILRQPDANRIRMTFIDETDIRNIVFCPRIPGQ